MTTRTQNFADGADGDIIRKAINSFMDWVADYSYFIDDGCLYEGKMWISLVDANIGITPVVGTSWKSYSLENLDNVVLTTPTDGDVLSWNGTEWVNVPPVTVGYGTNIIVNGDFELVNTGGIPSEVDYGENIITNGDFEIPGISPYFWDGWTNGTGTGVSDETSALLTHSTGHSCKIVKGSGTWYANAVTRQITVTGGQQYRLQFWVYGDNVSPGRYSIQDYADNVYLGDTGPVGASVGSAGASWYQVSAFFDTPDSCTSIRLRLVPANVSGAISYFDDFKLQLVPTTIPSGTIWDKWGNTTGVSNETTALLTHSAGHSCKIVKDSSGTWSSNAISQVITVESEKQYRLQFWVYGDGLNPGKYDIQDTTSYYQYNIGHLGGGTPVDSSDTSWKQITVVFTTSIGCTEIRLRLIPANVSGAISYFDDFSMQLTPTQPQAVITPSDAGNIQPRVILPNRFTAVVGDKLQLFLRGIVETGDPYSQPWEYQCSKGIDYRRYFSYTPVAGDVAGSPYTLTVNVLDNTGSPTASNYCKIDVVAATAQPDPAVKVLCMGDSITAGEIWSTTLDNYGVWPQEFYRRLTGTAGTPAGLEYANITFIGEKPMKDYSTQGYLGIGGLQWSDFAGTTLTTAGHILTVASHTKTAVDINSNYTIGSASVRLLSIVNATHLRVYGVSGTMAASGTLIYVSGGTDTGDIVYSAKTDIPVTPLLNTAGTGISFADYVARNSFGTIDVLYVLLGWNGMTGSNLALASNWTSMVASMTTVLNRFHTDYASGKVKLMGLNMPPLNGALGAFHGATGTNSNYYKTLRSVNGLNLAYQKFATDNSAWCEFISVSQQFDAENNFPFNTTPVNTRSAITEPLGYNGVHPLTGGYLQIADAAYRNFIKNYCSS